MNDVLKFILLLLGAICFVLATLGADRPPRLDWAPLGLLFWILVPLISAAENLH